MSYSLFSKLPSLPTDIVTHLESKGLTINNRPKAEKFLSFINYHRFKIYIRLFQDQSTPGTYRQDRSFDDGIELYRFDDELRGFAFAIIGRIEVKLRSRLDQVVTSSTNNPFWYLDQNLFHNGFAQKRTVSELAKYFQNSRDDYPIHYKSKYYNQSDDSFKQLPPFWGIAELATFGNIKTLYKSINKGAFHIPGSTNPLDRLAADFGATNLRCLNNWIELINAVRNRCAHHSRIWNFNFRNPSDIINRLSITPRSNRIYLFLAVAHSISANIGLGVDIKQFMVGLFDKYPISKKYYNSAGFPINWETDPFWL